MRRDGLPTGQADQCHGHGTRDCGPEKADGGGIVASDLARGKAVGRKHHRPQQRQRRLGGKHAAARLQHDQNADEAHAGGHPAPPADLFAQNRTGQDRDQQRIAGKDRVGVDQPQLHEGGDGDDDLQRQQHAAKDLQPRTVAAHCPQAAGLAQRDDQHHGGKEPVAQHGDEDRGIGRAQIARHSVLSREHEGREAHQQDRGALAILDRARLRRRNGGRLGRRGHQWPRGIRLGHGGLSGLVW